MTGNFIKSITTEIDVHYLYLACMSLHEEMFEPLGRDDFLFFTLIGIWQRELTVGLSQWLEELSLSIAPTDRLAE
jgi:hypothetical protein